MTIHRMGSGAPGTEGRVLPLVDYPIDAFDKHGTA